jgi:anti-sigma-K factor RskA
VKKEINIEEYINSGVLEQYALGLTSVTESEEIALLLKQYPELRSELSKIEESLEIFAKQYAKPLPDYLKTKILNSIEVEKTRTDLHGKNSFLNYFLYGMLCLLVATSVYFWNENKKQLDKLSGLINEHQQLEIKYVQDSLALTECRNNLSEYTNREHNRILLKGTIKSPQSFAAVYYDTISKKTYLDIMNLPETSSQKQYQLWGIVAGKPVDLGVIDLLERKNLKEIRFIEQVQAFAITLEPYGGKTSPSMDEMYVIGGI